MKLRNIFMILASAALLTACDDVFTPAAENMKDINEMENDPIMAKGFVLTAYRNLPNYEVGTGTDVATDDAVTNEKGANWSKYATGSWTVQSWDPTGRWNNDLSSMQYLYIFLNSNISNIGFLKNANENKLMRAAWQVRPTDFWLPMPIICFVPMPDLTMKESCSAHSSLTDM